MRGRSAGGEDAPLGVGRHGDAADAGMRMRAAQEHDLLRAGQADVGNKLAAPAQMPVVLPAQQRRADTERAGRGGVDHAETVWSGVPALSSRASAAAAAAMAVTMLV